MKRYYIFDCILYFLSILLYVLFLCLNKNKTEMFYYESYVFYLGLMIPLIYLVTILIKQLKIKEYLGSKYWSFMAYGIVLTSGFVYMLIIHVISVEWFNKLHIFLWILEPIIYIIFIILGVFLNKKDKKKNKNLKFKLNQ